MVETVKFIADLFSKFQLKILNTMVYMCIFSWSYPTVSLSIIKRSMCQIHKMKPESFCKNVLDWSSQGSPHLSGVTHTCFVKSTEKVRHSLPSKHWSYFEKSFGTFEQFLESSLLFSFDHSEKKNYIIMV